MGIRDLLFGTKASIIGLSAAEQPDRPLERTFDDATLLSTYRDDAWPYILINYECEQVAQVPLRLGTPGADGEFTFVPPTNPFQQLIDRPNPQMDGGEFLHLLFLYLEITGHAPIEVVKLANGRGRAGELWLHNPGPWRIVANRDASIRGYLYLQENTQDIRWAPEQMTYLRWPDPNNRWYGQGRISAVRQQVMAQEYAALRDKNFEKNLGVPPGILSSEMPLGDPQAKELQERWSRAVGGYRNAGKIAVLGSKTTYVPVALNARDAQWLEQQKWRVETLAAAIGIAVPLVMMSDSTFNNVAGARAELWEGKLQPRLNRVARMLTQRLLPLIGVPDGMELRPDYTQIEALGENDLEAAQTASEWSKTGAVTVDEVRTRLGLKPHKDKELGARLLVPSSVSPKSAEDIKAPPEPPALPGAPSAPPKPPAKTLKHEPRDRERVLGPIRDGYKRDLASFFRAQEGAVLGGLKTIKEATEPLAPEVIAAIEAVIGAVRFRDRIKRISETPISASLTIGAEDAAALLGVESAFDIEASETAIARLTSYVERLGVGIQNTTLADVRGVLETALRSGWDIAETRSALGDLFDGYQDWRLDRIARTETAAAYNLGQIDQFKSAGVQLVRVIDGDGDDVCAQANGSLWTLEEAEGTPLGHPNCTRTWIPEIA